MPPGGDEDNAAEPSPASVGNPLLENAPSLAVGCGAGPRQSKKLAPASPNTDGRTAEPPLVVESAPATADAELDGNDAAEPLPLLVVESASATADADLDGNDAAEPPALLVVDSASATADDLDGNDAAKPSPSVVHLENAPVAGPPPLPADACGDGPRQKGPSPPFIPVDDPLEMVRKSLGFVTAVSRAKTRFREGVRRGYEVLAKRLGTVLLLCSGVHVLTLVYASFLGQGETYAFMTNALSASGFVLHAALTLAHNSKRRQCAAHFGLIVMDALVKGAFALMQRNFTSAAINFVGWGCVLYPLAGWGLRRMLHRAHQLDRATKDELSYSTLTAFATSSMPILYFFCNGVLCVAFEGESHCAIRAKVDYVAILTILGNAMLFVLLTITPVSLKQAVWMNIRTPQLVAFSFQGILMGLALALHSQNENFGPVTPAIEYMGRASDLCLVFCIIACAVNIIGHGAAPVIKIEQGGHGVDPVVKIEPGGHGADPVVKIEQGGHGADQVVLRNAQYGDMIPYRGVMAVLTVIYLGVEAAPVGEVIRDVFSPLSCAAALFHFWLRAEDESVGRSVKLHFWAHASSAMISGMRNLLNGNIGMVLIMLAYLTVIYPGIYRTLTRFRSLVRAHGTDAAANLASVSFVAFWSAVMPVILYLGADSLGTHRHQQPSHLSPLVC